MLITTEQHRQSFIDCIESAILDGNITLARSLIAECEVTSENKGVELLTIREILVYYTHLSILSNNTYHTYLDDC